MEKFVNELTNQLEGLNQQIDDVKKKIQDYNIRGAAIEKTDEIIRVKEWLDSLHFKLHDFEKTFFYSDSVNDIPLLETVTDPIATNPDDILHEHAEKRGWLIINIFDNA